MAFHSNHGIFATQDLTADIVFSDEPTSDQDLYNHLVDCGDDPQTIDAMLDIGHTIQSLYQDHVNAGLEPIW